MLWLPLMQHINFNKMSSLNNKLILFHNYELWAIPEAKKWSRTVV